MQGSNGLLFCQYFYGFVFFSKLLKNRTKILEILTENLVKSLSLIFAFLSKYFSFFMCFRNTIQETLILFSYLHEVSQKFITFLFTISAEGEFPQQPSSTIHLANLLTHLTESRSLIKLCGNIHSFHKTSACLSRNSDIRLIL